MSKFSRRLFAQRGNGRTSASPNGGAAAAAIEGTSRKAFIQSTAGAASAAAVVLATPKVASVAMEATSPGSTLPKPVVTEPSGVTPREPVTAYVRNAERHEVTVMVGKTETTYKDPVLVKRLLDAGR